MAIIYMHSFAFSSSDFFLHYLICGVVNFSGMFIVVELCHAHVSFILVSLSSSLKIKIIIIIIAVVVAVIAVVVVVMMEAEVIAVISVDVVPRYQTAIFPH